MSSSLENLLKYNLRIEINLVKISEMLDNVISKIKNEKQIKDYAGTFVKQLYEFNHPLFRRIINWGNVGRRSRIELRKKVEDILRKTYSSKEEIRISDIKEIYQLIHNFRNEVIRDIIKEISNATKGIRRYHVPSSVAFTEARNLYFGEKFSENQLLELTEKFLRSICIGNWISVYFEKSTLSYVQENIQHLVMEKFPQGKGHIPSNGRDGRQLQ